jgi:ribosome recycling factor
MSIMDNTKSKMTAAIEHFKEELKSIRTGRANPAMVDSVFVDAYGSQMRIKEIASITVPEPRQLVITPFDAGLKGAIGKAIEKANLGFMPIVDGNLVRIKIPPMDETQRKEMVKLCHRRKEEAKVSIRNIRRDGNEEARKQKSLMTIAEDEMKRLEKQIQELTDKFCKDAEDLADKKEKEISAI